jgi:hypothetical protein
MKIRKIKLKNNAQLKIQETAFMLIALILFFVLVILFVMSIVYKNLYQKANDLAQERTLSAITNLAGTSEFICPGSKTNCVDEDKVMALKDKKSYNEFWAFSSLYIIKSSGFSKDEKEFKECNLGNYPDCDIIRIYDKGIKSETLISSFVALCRREYENNYPYEKCDIAKLIAGTEVKTIKSKNR